MHFTANFQDSFRESKEGFQEGLRSAQAAAYAGVESANQFRRDVSIEVLKHNWFSDGTDRESTQQYNNVGFAFFYYPAHLIYSIYGITKHATVHPKALHAGNYLIQQYINRLFDAELPLEDKEAVSMPHLYRAQLGAFWLTAAGLTLVTGAKLISLLTVNQKACKAASYVLASLAAELNNTLFDRDAHVVRPEGLSAWYLAGAVFVCYLLRRFSGCCWY